MTALKNSNLIYQAYFYGPIFICSKNRPNRGHKKYDLTNSSKKRRESEMPYIWIQMSRTECVPKSALRFDG